MQREIESGKGNSEEKDSNKSAAMRAKLGRVQNIRLDTILVPNSGTTAKKQTPSCSDMSLTE